MHLRNSNEGVERAVLQSVAKKNLTSKSLFFLILFYVDGGCNKDEAEKQNSLFETQTLISFFCFLGFFTISYLYPLIHTFWHSSWLELSTLKQTKQAPVFVSLYSNILSYSLFLLFNQFVFGMWVISELRFDQNLVPKLFINVIYSPWTLFLTLSFPLLLFPNTLLRSGGQWEFQMFRNFVR